MTNPATLVPQAHKLTGEEASKGGKNSVEARRKKKLLKEIIEMFGDLKVESENLQKMMKMAGIKDTEQMTNDLAMIIGQYRAAQKGNTNAAVFIRDTKGEKPKDVIENHNINYKPLIDLTDRKKNGSSEEKTD